MRPARLDFALNGRFAAPRKKLPGNAPLPAIELNRQTLSALPSSVRVPAYDVSRVTPGIVHIGLGGFHRAHMARYMHELMERRADALGWGIVGAGVLPADRAMRDALTPQQGLYTLVERSGTAETAAIIGSVTRVIFAGESSAELLQVLDDPAIRVVSLTVSEAGYCLDRTTRLLDLGHEAIRHDLAEPRNPTSAIGIIVEACRRRREAGLPGFTALSCDNIQHNGKVLRKAVQTLAGARDPALLAWIDAEVSFPGTMVDRITPVTQPDQIAALRDRYGIIDRWPVFSETFSQWVIEDDFVCGRPAWEEVGALFVADAAPYEFMKLRLLNASHLAAAGLGRLSGYTYVHESMADPLISAYMAALMDREVEPTLLPVPGVDLAAYKRSLIERFSNPAVQDTVARINAAGSVNLLLDPIRDRLKVNGRLSLLALALASWCRRVRGEDEQGHPIEVRHPLAALLRDRAIAGGPDPRPLLSVRELFGETGEDPRLIEAVGQWLESLYSRGVKETLRRAVTQPA